MTVPIHFGDNAEFRIIQCGILDLTGECRAFVVARPTHPRVVTMSHSLLAIEDAPTNFDMPLKSPHAEVRAMAVAAFSAFARAAGIEPITDAVTGLFGRTVRGKAVAEALSAAAACRDSEQWYSRMASMAERRSHTVLANGTTVLR